MPDDWQGLNRGYSDTAARQLPDQWVEKILPVWSLNSFLGPLKTPKLRPGSGTVGLEYQPSEGPHRPDWKVLSSEAA